jgi:hypothetical protein
LALQIELLDMVFFAGDEFDATHVEGLGLFDGCFLLRLEEIDHGWMSVHDD